MQSEREKNVLSYWFGRVEQTVVPSEGRARVWFAEDAGIDAEVKESFAADLDTAMLGGYRDWLKSARGQLALIIIFDQFSRHIHRGTAAAFTNDQRALDICTKGMESELDHTLSLIERVFYYFPLMHSEDMAYQEASRRAFENLVQLSLPETKVIYESFFKFANHHYNIVHRFARFPQRNAILGRESTEEELQYLKELD